MKYILSEFQCNLILESEKYEKLFQGLVNTHLDYCRKECEQGNEYESDIDDYVCDQLESVSEVKVTSADWVNIFHKDTQLNQKYMSIRLMFYYSSIRRGELDADDLTYELEQHLRKSTSMPVIVNYKSTNTNTQFDW